MFYRITIIAIAALFTLPTMVFGQQKNLKKPSPELIDTHQMAKDSQQRQREAVQRTEQMHEDSQQWHTEVQKDTKRMLFDQEEILKEERAETVQRAIDFQLWKAKQYRDDIKGGKQYYKKIEDIEIETATNMAFTFLLTQNFKMFRDDVEFLGASEITYHDKGAVSFAIIELRFGTNSGEIKTHVISPGKSSTSGTPAFLTFRSARENAHNSLLQVLEKLNERLAKNGIEIQI